MNEEHLAGMAEVLGAVVFGSSARGDSDAHSDLDVFVLCADLSFTKLASLKRRVAHAVGCHHSSISTYCVGNAMEMARSGSAFIWHLTMEGRVVFSRGGAIEKLFASFEPYGNYREDLALYRSLLDEVEQSLKRFPKPNGFDLALLFTICRNTCMRISFALGEPRFGRRSAFVVATARFGSQFPLSETSYEELLGWKLWYERGTAKPRGELSREDTAAIIEQAARLIDLGLDVCPCC